MFNPVTIPFGVKMLFNVVELKPEVTIEQVETVLGEMCNVVKNTYGNDNGGFIGGQVFNYSGFVSEEGSFDKTAETKPHVVILTYWESFEQHEASHADPVFKQKFDDLRELCVNAYELGYTMLWQSDLHE